MKKFKIKVTDVLSIFSMLDGRSYSDFGNAADKIFEIYDKFGEVADEVSAKQQKFLKERDSLNLPKDKKTGDFTPESIKKIENLMSFKSLDKLLQSEKEFEFEPLTKDDFKELAKNITDLKLGAYKYFQGKIM